MSASSESFFIGWAAAPKRLRAFLGAAALSVVAVFGGLGWLLAAAQDDPGDGAFRWDWGRQEAVGVLTAQPYPVLHVVESDRFPAGGALLLSGVGKRGVRDRAEPLDGRLVRASGVALKRGDLDMLQLRGGSAGLAAAEGRGVAPEAVDLGRWRVTGEICDGKCYAGAMRPGEGIAHKACANLCITGGAPPLFVATGPIDGEDILLLADAEGGPIPEALLARTAEIVEIEGRAERRGGLVVLKVDPETVRRAP